MTNGSTGVALFDKGASAVVNIKLTKLFATLHAASRSAGAVFASTKLNNGSDDIRDISAITVGRTSAYIGAEK